MADVIVPVHVVLTDEELDKLSHGGYITTTICDKCYSLVPLDLIVAHGQKVHNGS